MTHPILVDVHEECLVVIVVEKFGYVSAVGAGHCRNVRQFEARIKIYLVYFKKRLDFNT